MKEKQSEEHPQTGKLTQTEMKQAGSSMPRSICTSKALVF